MVLFVVAMLSQLPPAYVSAAPQTPVSTVVEVEPDGDEPIGQRRLDLGGLGCRKPLERGVAVDEIGRRLALPVRVEQPVHVHRMQQLRVVSLDRRLHQLHDLAVELRHLVLLLTPFGDASLVALAELIRREEVEQIQVTAADVRVPRRRAAA